MTKQDIINSCRLEIETRIQNTQTAIESARESANSEQKSTAGDKHDTARAIAQFEQEKLSAQLSEQLKLRETLSRINANAAASEVRIGSLVKCSNGLFFIGVGLGKIEVMPTGSQVDGTTVFSVSLASPLGTALLGKKEGEDFEVNGRTFKVLELS